MKKRSVLAMVMAMGMVMGLAVPASAAENYKIAWVDGNLANESNAICTDAAKAYAEENNVDFTLLDGQGSGENQVSQIETLIAQGVDCIIVQPYDAAACQVGVEAAIDADIPVLVTKTTIEDNSICPFVGQDDTVAGEMEMEWMAEQLGGKGNIVVIEGPTGISAAIQRNDGITKTLEKYPDITVLHTQPADWNRDEGMSLMETWLQEGKEIDGVVAHNDEMALGAVEAYKNAGYSQEQRPVIFGIDGLEDALEAVKEGTMQGTVYNDNVDQAGEIARLAVDLFKGNDISKHKLKDGRYYMSLYQKVETGNVDEFLEK